MVLRQNIVTVHHYAVYPETLYHCVHCDKGVSTASCSCQEETEVSRSRRKMGERYTPSIESTDALSFRVGSPPNRINCTWTTWVGVEVQINGCESVIRNISICALAAITLIRVYSTQIGDWTCQLRPTQYIVCHSNGIDSSTTHQLPETS